MLAIGLCAGAVVGAAGMYLALEQPWRSTPRAAAAPADAGVTVATSEKPKRKRTRRRGGDPGAPAIDEAPPIVLSVADRQLSWRGDSVERPPAAVDLGTDGEARALSGAEIQMTIDRDGSAVQRCVIDAVGNAPYAGEVTVMMLVDGEGRVQKVRVRAPAFMHAKNLLGCVRGAARRMRYPAVGGWTVVTLPMPIEL